METSPLESPDGSPGALAPIFESDVLLASQFFTIFRRDGGLSRERLLMLAVLEDAIETYRRYARTRAAYGHRLFDEARQWVESNDRSWLFSFETICDALGLDPSYVRRGLRASIAGPRGRELTRARLHEQRG